MNNYNKQKLNTLLYLRFKHDISESFGNIVPYPQKHFISDSGSFSYAWNLDGYFNTSKSLEYLNDIIARFIITFPNEDVRKQQVTKYSSNKNGLELKTFQNLKSIKTPKKQQIQVSSNIPDQIFWALKIYAEILIKENGIIIYSIFEDYAFNQFEHKAKDRSTLRAKCRNIFNWYCERDFKLSLKQNRNNNKSNEEINMTRLENVKKIHKNKIHETNKKISNIINGLFSHEYKKRNGKFDITRIAKETNLHRNTVSLYLKEKGIN